MLTPTTRALAAISCCGAAAPSLAQDKAAIDAALEGRARASTRGLKEGKNADYIPALAKVDLNIFGIAVVTVDGRIFYQGDIKSAVLDPIDLQGLHHGLV